MSDNKYLFNLIKNTEKVELDVRNRINTVSIDELDSYKHFSAIFGKVKKRIMETPPCGAVNTLIVSLDDKNVVIDIEYVYDEKNSVPKSVSMQFNYRI